jgi:surfactin family lipopeptide synthetase C
MTASNVEDLYPLSPAQQGILFYALAAPESGVYFEQFPLSYDQGLDPDVFVVAWQQVVDRHPILRTSFLWEDLESPVQIVHRKVQIPVERHDWRGKDPEQQQRDLAAHAGEDRRRGFDLTRPPLLRLALFRFGDESYRVIWSHHHLVLDGWSVGLMMREIFLVYQAISRGETAPLPARRPFRDYIGWLRQQDPAAAEPYWRRVLGGFRRPTPLPAPLTPTSGIPPDYDLRLIRLTPELTARLKAFAQRHRLTLVTLVYGAWALYLSRSSGERDVAFGTTVSGRSPALAGVDSMLGCLINTLPVRVKVNPEAELVPWLQALQRSLVELRQHDHTPLADVLGWAEVPRRVPLFESLVIFESFSSEASFVMSHNGFFQRAHYPLTLVSSPDPVVTLRLGFEPSRFPVDRALQVLHDLEALLAAMAEDPARRLGALPLLSPEPGPRDATEPEPAVNPPTPSRIAPRNERERAIAALWQQALHLDEVGVEDDFWDLGGHSLLLLRIADKIRARRGKQVPWDRLLACRTVAELAEAAADQSVTVGERHE